MQQLPMSARAYHRILKLARTITDPSAGSGQAGRERAYRNGAPGGGDPVPAGAAVLNRKEARMDRPIVLEHLDDAVLTWIAKEAEQRGLSVETMILELIRQGIKNTQLETYHDLDALAGTWSDKEADEFLKAIAEFEQVDEKLWR
jgi:hypothetical protein